MFIRFSRCVIRRVQSGDGSLIDFNQSIIKNYFKNTFMKTELIETDQFNLTRTQSD